MRIRKKSRKNILTIEQKALHSLFRNAVTKFSTKTRNLFSLFSKNKLYEKPWVLIVGNEGSGKSALLEYGELIVSHHYPELRNTELCDFWYTDDAIYLDLKGRHCVSNTKQNLPNLWLHLLKLIKNVRHKKPLDSVIVVISLSELLSEDETEKLQLIAYLKTALQTLIQTLGDQFSISLVISKLDLLSGFNEFFAELAQEERWQEWGIEFNTENTNLTTHFNVEFKDIVKRLHNQLIWRLQHESNQKKRALINDFPLQFESLKTTLGDMLQKLFSEFYLMRKPRIKGVYFTSSQQHGSPVDRIGKSLRPVFNINPTQGLSLPSAQRPFFSKNVLQNVTHTRNNLPKKGFSLKISKSSLAAFMFSALLIASTLWISVLGFQERTQQLNSAQQTINQYQFTAEQLNRTDYPLDKLLTTLLNLKNITNAFNTATPFINYFAKNKIKTLREKSLRAYQTALRNILVPRLRNEAEQSLFNSSPKDPKQIYRALKVYLMFTQPKNADKTILASWINEQLKSKNLKPEENKQLSDDLFAQLTSQPNLPENTSLVAKARLVLNKLSTSQLAFVILTAGQSESTTPLFNNGANAIFSGPYSNVPEIYTLKGLAKLNAKVIQNACIEATQGNFVLGTNQPITLSALQLQTLNDSIKSLYLQVYSQVWQDVINKTHLKKINDLHQSITTLAQLEGNQSQLMNFLRTIDINTSPLRENKSFFTTASATATIPPELKMQLQILHVLLTPPDQSAAAQLQPLLNNITQLSQQLTSAIKSNDPGRAIFALTTQRMRQQNDNDPLHLLALEASEAPEPLQRFISALTQNIWDNMLDESHHYINTVWNNSIYATYKTNLFDKYPFNKSAAEQSSLDGFTQFFVQNGTLDTFIDNYLKPFIDTSTQTWKLKEVDGKTIGISNENLLQLQLASLIKKMYFPNNEATLNIPFTLQPIALEAPVKNVSFSYNSKKFMFESKTATDVKLTWPAIAFDAPIEIAFQHTDGHVAIQTERGPWGLFKLLGQAKLESTTVPNHFNVTFNVNGSKAKYVLIANTALSPFIPNVLDKFHCPEIL